VPTGNDDALLPATNWLSASTIEQLIVAPLLSQVSVRNGDTWNNYTVKAQVCWYEIIVGPNLLCSNATVLTSPFHILLLGTCLGKLIHICYEQLSLALPLAFCMTGTALRS
jgi:hypothetical protein